VASTTRVHGYTIIASVALHAAVGGTIYWVAVAMAMGPSSRAAEVPHVPEPGDPVGQPSLVTLPAIADGILVEEEPVDRTGEPPRVTGGDAIPHLDTRLPGHGGDQHVLASALNLADQDAQMRLSPDPLSHLDRDQLQRLQVARSRQSWEDRRSTTHPTELTLLVTGLDAVLERRPVSSWEPSRGVVRSPAAGVRGGEVGAASVREEGESDRVVGGAQLGSLDEAPGAGFRNARPGTDHRASAPVGSARPDVARAAIAVPAIDAARPKDDVDSDQEVATTVRSLVHASTAGGILGFGRGGQGGEGDPAFGGASGAESHARPLGIGEGDVFDYWTKDPHFLPYFRQIHAKIDPLWANAFPKSALYELKQGTVILEFTVFADGRTVVSWPPARPSGIGDFDRNCADSIRRASPLPPIPRELGLKSVRIRAPFIADNPVIK
jgi:TonB family protein